jgi:hypothetical protein
LERLGQERLQLEERAEREAETLRTTLEELLAFDRTHRRVIGPERFSIRADSPAPPDLPREIAAWFRGRFKKAIPAIGEDYRSPSYGKAGPSLPERDPLTPTASEAPGGEAHEAKLAEG